MPLVAVTRKIVSFEHPCIYKIDCSCEKSYIEQTNKNHIGSRNKEHKQVDKSNDVKKSVISEHLLVSGPNYWIELHRSRILLAERH